MHVCRHVLHAHEPAINAARFATHAHIFQVLAWAREWLPGLHTLAHAAGVPGFHTLDVVSDDAFWDVAKPKVGGTAALLGAAASECECVTMFSSTSSIWSQTGSCHYAAANAWLDANAHELRCVSMQHGAVPVHVDRCAPGCLRHGASTKCGIFRWALNVA